MVMRRWALIKKKIHGIVAIVLIISDRNTTTLILFITLPPTIPWKCIPFPLKCIFEPVMLHFVIIILCIISSQKTQKTTCNDYYLYLCFCCMHYLLWLYGCISAALLLHCCCIAAALLLHCWCITAVSGCLFCTFISNLNPKHILANTHYNCYYYHYYYYCISFVYNYIMIDFFWIKI